MLSGPFLLLLAAAGALETDPGAGDTPVPALERAAPPTLAAGTFEGVLPCADCPGIRHRLTLSSDRTYHLQTEYLDRPHGVRDEIGSWASSPDGKTLVLEGSREGARYFAIAAADRLTQLDTRGDVIASPASHDLVRVAAPSPVEPRLALSGLFTYMADAALFEECRTRRRMPVATEGGYQALERAYLAERAAPGAAVRAHVEGRIVDRVNMEGPARPTLVVERFLELQPRETCPPRFAAVALEGTYWKLTELEGAPLAPDPARPAREAHLVFGRDPRRASGADGCNAMVGGYELEGTRLKFDQLAGTRMACPDLGNLDQLFRQALARTASLRLLGPALQLRDGAGVLLARFAAVPRPAGASRP
jgi:copper homeostasis protein (lipoprotein)